MRTARRASVAAFVLLALFVLLKSARFSKSTSSSERTPETVETLESRDSFLDIAPFSPPFAEAELEIEDAQRTDKDRTRLAKRLAHSFPYNVRRDFPTKIWQTWKYAPSDAEFDVGLLAFETSWPNLNPDSYHQVVADSEAVLMIQELYVSVPEVIQAYDALPKPVLKADFFRYLILLAQGGVYSDIDTTALKPVADWFPTKIPIESYGLVVGIEADPDRPDWAEYWARRLQFCQWTMMSKPGHPVLVDIVAFITEETLRRQRLAELDDMHMKSVMEFTGPGIWTDIIFDHLHDPDDEGVNPAWHKFANLTKPMRVSDVLVLPITSFSPGIGAMGAENTEHPLAFAYHSFQGSWKT